MIRVFVFLGLFLGVSAATAASTNFNVDVGQLTPEQQAQFMALVTAAQESPGNVTPEKLRQWVTASEAFAQAVGGAVGGAAKELGMAANEFLATDAGKLTAVALLWNYIGKDWWGIVGSSIICPFLLFLVYLSARHFHFRERIKTKPKDGPVSITYVPRYEFRGNDARVTSAWMHGVAFALISLVWLLLAF